MNLGGTWVNVNKVIIGLVCLVLVTAGCVIPQGGDEEQKNSGGPPETFKKFDLFFSTPPEFNKPVELTLDVVYFYNIPNVTIQIDLPEGFELISGDLSWQGDLIENTPIQLKAVVKPVKTGEWVIKGKVKFRPDSMGYTPLYVSVSEDSIEVSKTPPSGWVAPGAGLKRVQ